MMHAEWFSGVRSCGALQSKSRMKSSAKSNVKDVGSELDLLKCTMVANTRSKRTKPKGTNAENKQKRTTISFLLPISLASHLQPRPSSQSWDPDDHVLW